MSMTKEEFESQVPPPPQDTPAPMTEPDEDRIASEFYAELSGDFEEEDRGALEVPEEEPPQQVQAEPSAPPPPAEPPQPQARTEEPPTLAPQVQQPQEPQQPAPTEEELRRAYAAAFEGLEKQFASQMDDKFVEQLIENPKAVLARVAAMGAMHGMQQAHQMLAQQVPLMAQRVSQDTIRSELTRRAFFTKYKNLTPHQVEFDQFLGRYRMLPENQSRGFKDIADEAAAAFMAYKRIPMGMPTPTPAPMQTPPPPPPPVSGPGTAPPTNASRDNFWASFADDILQEDF